MILDIMKTSVENKNCTISKTRICQSKRSWLLLLVAGGLIGDGCRNSGLKICIN